MRVKVWGVRGSIPSCVEKQSIFGSNTTCISIEFDDVLVICDAGSGLFPCAHQIGGSYKKIILCLTHLHWDHIIALPFFSGFYQKDTEVIMASPHPKFDSGLLHYLMNGVQFPITSDMLLNQPVIVKSNLEDMFKPHQVKFQHHLVFHPGGAYAFAFEKNNKRVVFCPDNEINPDNINSKEIINVLKFFNNADLLIHDSQYLNHEFPAKKGWGHTFLSTGLEAFSSINLKQLALTHHDPIYSDQTLLENERFAQEWLQEKNKNIRVQFLKEGQAFDL